MITPKITNLGNSNLWTDMSTILGYASNFTQQIQKLFANGEQGFFYDPSDMGTMFQDSAGTIPVTAAGQPVGLIRDKSGRNNHAFQTNSALRPILRKNATTGANYLEFDGGDDFLQTSNINFTATDKVSLFAGVRKLSDSTNGVLLELSALVTSNSGTFCVLAPRYAAAAGNFGVISKGTVLTELTTPTILAPISAVISMKSSILASGLSMRVNGALSASSNNSQGTGNYGNYPLYIGRRAGTSLPFNGHLYSLIGVGKLASDSETLAIEKELAKRTGVTLSV